MSASPSSWRPRNETAEDLAREHAAKGIVERAWCATATKLSESLYQIDWAFSRGERLMAFGEYKYRRAKYTTLMFSYAKWQRGTQLADSAGVPFLVIVEWSGDGIYYLDHRTVRNPIIQIGGNSRGQNGDIEPVVHLRTDQFIRVWP